MPLLLRYTGHPPTSLVACSIKKKKSEIHFNGQELIQMLSTDSSYAYLYAAQSYFVFAVQTLEA